MAKRTKKSENFLKFIAHKNERYRWVELEDDIVQIQIDRNSPLDKIVRLFFKTPQMMKIDLDTFGSFIWKQIDGQRNMIEIAALLEEQFGEEVQPLYERLGSYMNILRNNKFITLDKSKG